MKAKEKEVRVLELARQNLSYSEIGDYVGLTRQRVSQICLKHGIIRRPQDIKPENWLHFWEKIDPILIEELEDD